MNRRWLVLYSLAYDGGGSEFVKTYRTRWGARWSMFWHVYVWSWGGTADLVGPEDWQ